MNERIDKLLVEAGAYFGGDGTDYSRFDPKKFAKLIMEGMHREVIASILITDVVMEAKGQTPTTEDYIRAINKDFGVEE